MTDLDSTAPLNRADVLAQPTASPAAFVPPPGQQPHPGSLINVLSGDLQAARDELAFTKAALNEREVWIREHLRTEHPQAEPNDGERLPDPTA